MMELKLKIIIIIVMLVLLLYMFNAVRGNKISLKNILIWIIADVIVIFGVLFLEILFDLANFIGVETVSNMMFFLGFIFLIVLCFNLSSELSIQNKKIISLTQEVGILKNRLEKEKK